MQSNGIWDRDEAAQNHVACEGLRAHLRSAFRHDLPVRDYGCGLGHYCVSLAAQGFDVEGLEGTRELGELAVYRRIDTADLTQHLERAPAQGLCLEVGEHIPAEFEAVFLDNLTRLSRRRIVLSWAVPGQGGLGHVNCQTNAAVISKLAARGWGFHQDLTDHLRARVSEVCWWFRNTLMVFDELERNVDRARIVMATDDRGLRATATTLASAARRSSLPVEACVFYRGDQLPAEVDTEPLRVHVRRPKHHLAGSIPAHVTQSTFDRVLAIPELPDWDRALILDLDQVVLGDIALLCRTPFEDSLLAARRWNTTLGQAARDWFGRRLPPAFEAHESAPYFYMGPLMNLDGMRRAGTWERFLAFHEAAHMEEQLGLAVATAGRLKGVHPMWNLIPQWDDMESTIGVVHWTGPAKPWHEPAVCWRPEVWRAENTAWADLGRTFSRR